MNNHYGLKKFFLFCLISLIFPFQVFGQSISQNQATVSPIVRNRLQLLNNPEAADNHFRQISRRITALINRFNKINSRIKTRIGKLQESKTVVNRLNSQLDVISGKLANLENKQKEIEDSWRVVLENKSSQDYQTLKNKLKEVVNSLKALIDEEKSLLKELKKFKSIEQPEKVATPSIQE